jgi:hypothetical protein
MPQKKIRATVIAKYMARAGIARAVCFTSGSAAQALRYAGVDVLAIGPEEKLQAATWWTPADISRWFPDCFDATSGHLPAHLMVYIARALRSHVGQVSANEIIEVPTGSGETITCLRWAYPGVLFVPVYNVGQGTEYHHLAPLNMVVEAAQNA